MRARENYHGSGGAVDNVSSAGNSQHNDDQRLKVCLWSSGSALGQEGLMVRPHPTPIPWRVGDEFVGDNEKIETPTAPTTGGILKQ